MRPLKWNAALGQPSPSIRWWAALKPVDINGAGRSRTLTCLPTVRGCWAVALACFFQGGSLGGGVQGANFGTSASQARALQRFPELVRTFAGLLQPPPFHSLCKGSRSGRLPQRPPRAQVLRGALDTTESLIENFRFDRPQVAVGAASRQYSN